MWTSPLSYRELIIATERLLEADQNNRRWLALQ